MVNPSLSSTRGIYTGDQILSPFNQPGPVTRSSSRSRNEASLTGADNKTPHRLPFGSTDSNSSASSSGTTFSTRSDTSGDNQGYKGTPITPPSDYDEDVKGLEAPSYAADPKEVPALLLPSRGLSGESSGGSNRLREDLRSSTPQPVEEDEKRGSTRFMGAVTQGLGFVKIHNESPTVRRVRTLNLKRLADVVKVAKSAEAAEEVEEDDEAKRISGISEALRALGLDSKGNGTESGQEPEGIDEAVQGPEETHDDVVNGASRRPQPEQQQQTFFDVADSSSSSVEDGVSSLLNSETTVLLREAEEQSDAATTPTTKCSTPTSIPDNAAESVLEDRLDATASSGVGHQADFNEGSSSTSIEAVTPPRDLQNRESRRSLKVKDNAAVASSQSSRKRKGETQKESSADATSGMAAARQSQSRGKRSSAKPQGARLDSIPIFSNFDRKGLNTRARHDDLFKILQYNNKAKPKLRSPSKVETEPPSNGYVYIYTSSLCPGHVKIGMTKDTPRARISQWEKSCKLEITLMEDRESHPFLHFQLAEKLVQNELHNRRRKYRCHNCRVAHRQPIQEDTNMVHHGEWYEISEELGLATVQKWRRWLVTNRPYDIDGVLRPSWNEKYKVFLKETALVDRNEWVEAWIQPLKRDETILYFGRHSIKAIHDTCSNIQTFLNLVVGLLTPLQRIGEKAVELLSFFLIVVFVVIVAYFILSYVNELCAFLFVISFILMRLWITR